MPLDPAELPDDVAALKALLVAASLEVDDLDAEIENLKLTIAKLQHDQHGKPARRPLDPKLPRERRVEPAPTACPCCGGKLRKLGEDVTEMLERVPASWKVIQIVREKMTCRSCERITQPPAPSHPIARGGAGPHLLAEMLTAKYGAHL